MADPGIPNLLLGQFFQKDLVFRWRDAFKICLNRSDTGVAPLDERKSIELMYKSIFEVFGTKAEVDTSK